MSVPENIRPTYNKKTLCGMKAELNCHVFVIADSQFMSGCLLKSKTCKLIKKNSETTT